jgi:GntR family transcriptional regulator/MocR family aminotransferase
LLAEFIQSRLRKGSPVPLPEQLTGALRALVDQGHLPAGHEMPSTRSLARMLGIGRNSVIEAYANLVADGYCEARVGSGTYVSGRAAIPTPPAKVARTRAPAARLSARAERMLLNPEAAERGAFAPGAPDVSHFPFRTWQRLLMSEWHAVRDRDVQHAPAQAGVELREAIAQHLRRTRNTPCEPAQVVVVAGAQQGVDLVARLLADAGDRVWVEDPGYFGARRIFDACDLEVVPVPVDDDGFAPSAVQWTRPPRLIHVTPSHQFPTGVVMGAARRRALVALALQHRAWLIEDDYDGEFHFGARAVATLKSIDRAGCVIYVGSFSKTMFPALRLGYLVVPPAIATRFANAAAKLAFEGRFVEQRALARFIGEGHFEAHVARMRAIYRARRDALIDAWTRELGETFPVCGAESGMHVVAQLPRGMDVRVSAQAAKQGIHAAALGPMYAGAVRSSGLVLGYGGIDEREIRRAATELARIAAAMIL